MAASGLADHFERVAIVSEKDEATYRSVLQAVGVAPEDFLMVGNTVRSDVLPGPRDRRPGRPDPPPGDLEPRGGGPHRRLPGARAADRPPGLARPARGLGDRDEVGGPGDGVEPGLGLADPRRRDVATTEAVAPAPGPVPARTPPPRRRATARSCRAPGRQRRATGPPPSADRPGGACGRRRSARSARRSARPARHAPPRTSPRAASCRLRARRCRGTCPRG